MINQHCPEPAGPDYASPSIHIDQIHFPEMEERRRNEKYLVNIKMYEDVEKKNLFFSILKSLVEITRKIKPF